MDVDADLTPGQVVEWTILTFSDFFNSNSPKKEAGRYVRCPAPHEDDDGNYNQAAYDVFDHEFISKLAFNFLIQ